MSLDPCLKEPGKNVYELHFANALLFQSDFLPDVKIIIKSVRFYGAVDFYDFKIFQTKISASKWQAKLFELKIFSKCFLHEKQDYKYIQTYKEEFNAV